jgi:quercetin dioxygenase-like cupin family protein
VSEVAGPETALRWPGRERVPLLPGITASVASGEQLSAVLYTLNAGALVPPHDHESEEFGQVIRGSLELEIGGRTTVLAAGEGFLIPGHVPHGARAGDDGCELLECYAPPRAPVALAPQPVAE